MLKPYYQDKWVTIYHGDCREILPLIPDKSIDLVLTDPPYNIGHDWWDRRDGYIDWLTSVFKLCEARLKQNATLWFFHMVFDTLAELHLRLKNQTSLRHKQLLILDKGIKSIAGYGSDGLRSFPRVTEYIQFYSFDDPTGAEQLGKQYQAINPMAKYLKAEFLRAGVTNREIAALFPSRTGGMTGCVSNWLLGFNFPTEEQYQKMREYLNYEYLRKDYDDLRKDYDDLRKDYDDLRYTFNLDRWVTDVWQVDVKDNKYQHSASKPFLPIERIILTMTNQDDIILDPFLGSGTTCYCAKKLNRKSIGIEIEEKYCEIAANRCRQTVMELKI